MDISVLTGGSEGTVQNAMAALWDERKPPLPTALVTGTRTDAAGMGGLRAVSGICRPPERIPRGKPNARWWVSKNTILLMGATDKG